MDAVRGWLLAVLAVSLLVGIAQTLMPAGPVKAVGSLACGMVLFLAIARPVLGVRYQVLAQQIRDYTAEAAQTEEALTKTKNALQQGVIERRSRAYSLDKTEGLDCELELVWDWSQEPARLMGATVTGSLSQEEREELLISLADELGLQNNQIVFLPPEEGP